MTLQEAIEVMGGAEVWSAVSTEAALAAEERAYERGAANERAAVVAWLRTLKMPYCRQFAADIERGAHTEEAR